MRKILASLVMLGALTVGSQAAWGAPGAGKSKKPAAAKPAEPPPEPAPEPEPEPPPPAAEPAEPAPAAQAAAAPAAAADSTADPDASPVELAGKTYLFVGLRYRAIVVPKFMINLFGSGGETVLVHGFGPEFAIRKDGFEYNLSIWLAGYGLENVAFKAKDDPPEAWEIVNSSLKSLYFSADFLWSHDFSPEFALNYGGGGGFGIVFGSLSRVQAYPGAGANPDTGEGFVPCVAPGNPNGQYCGTDNEHYPGFEEPSWADGGSKPLFFPWLVLQTGLRYKPHRNFVGRFDMGFGTSGFFFGLGADYGL